METINKPPIQREFLGIYKLLRRLFYLKYRRKYIENQLKNRKGECKNCGCCGTMIIQCEYFRNRECVLWKEKGFEALPEDCKTYPFDEKDKTMFAQEHCGFYWEGK